MLCLQKDAQSVRKSLMRFQLLFQRILAKKTSQLDGLAARFCAELSPQTAFYATGNLPRAIRDACRTPIRYRETLITDGLYRIWQKNRKG